MNTINTGDIVGGYRIIDKIGEGGMGVVYKGADEKLERDVAIKFLLEQEAGENALKRFLREGSAIAKCNHTGIVRIYNCGEHEGRHYLVMEYIDGKPLGRFIEMARTLSQTSGQTEDLERFGYIEIPPDNESLPYFVKAHRTSPLNNDDHISNVCGLVSAIADALDEAHSHGILHRDIKPSNIIVSRDGTPKLLDFGLSKSSHDSNITSAHQILGTLRYIAPEYFSDTKTPTPAGDIYSLGVVFYELLTLAHPFEADNTSTFVTKVLSGKFEPPARLNRKIPSALNKIICKCLEGSPARRYHDCKSLISDLQKFNKGGQPAQTPILEGIKDFFFPHENSTPVDNPEPATLEREFPASGVQEIVVSTIHGDIEIATGENDRIMVRTTACKCGHCAPKMEIANGKLVLSIEDKKCEAGFAVSAPASLPVSLSTKSGDSKISKRGGKIKAVSASGDMLLENIDAEIKIATGSGDSLINRANGGLAIAAGSGDVSGKQISGNVTVKTGVGDTILSFAQGTRSDIDIKCGTGDICLAFPKGTRLAHKLQCGAGDIKNRFANTPDAGIRVKASTGIGDIDLSESGT